MTWITKLEDIGFADEASLRRALLTADGGGTPLKAACIDALLERADRSATIATFRRATRHLFAADCDFDAWFGTHVPSLAGRPADLIHADGGIEALIAFLDSLRRGATGGLESKQTSDDGSRRPDTEPGV